MSELPSKPKEKTVEDPTSLRLQPPPDNAVGWRWIETAPEAERVWVFVPNLGTIIALNTTHPSDGAVWWDGEEQIYHPTHWMPLPPPPGEAPSGDARSAVGMSERRNRRMPPCASCGHGWAFHVVPDGVENIDIYPTERWCVDDDCRCRSYVEPKEADGV